MLDDRFVGGSRSGAITLRWLVPAITAAIVAVPLAAQAPPADDALRTWGSVRFDSDTFAVPTSLIAAGGRNVVVLRNDGRLIVQGNMNVPEGPPAPAGLSYTQIAIPSGYFASAALALRSDGAIVSWNEIGTGWPAPALPANTTYTKVSAGYDHAAALRSDGTAVSWGPGTNGGSLIPAVPPGLTVVDVHACSQVTVLLLSNGAIITSSAPLQAGLAAVPALPPGLTFTAVWAGYGHAIAQRSDGTFVGWGANSYGQSTLPTLPPGVTFVSFAIGSGHTVALRSDGQVAAWGNDSYGQSTVPQLPTSAAIVQVFAGDSHSGVRYANGDVVRWGDTTQLGVASPVLQAGERWRRFEAGYGVVGMTTADRIVSLSALAGPPPAPPGMHYVDFAFGGHLVALRSDGRAIAWGSNSHGQLAIPPLPPGLVFTKVRASSNTVLLRSDGRLVEAGYQPRTIPDAPPGLAYVDFDCAGAGLLMLLSNGQVTTFGAPAPPAAALALPIGVRFVAVACGNPLYAALRSDGQVAVWGSSFSSGQPLPPAPPGVDYVEISTNGDHLLARRSDGQIAIAMTNNQNPARHIPTPRVGESFVGIAAGSSDLSAVHVGGTSTYVTFAPGCAGTLPASRIVPRDTPRIGRVHEVTIFDVPHDVAVLAFGLTAQPPASLATFGMPGCSQHVVVDAAVLLTGGDHNVRSQLSIPSSVGFVGLEFFNQAVVLDLAANPAGAVVSSASRAVIGH